MVEFYRQLGQNCAPQPQLPQPTAHPADWHMADVYRNMECHVPVMPRVEVDVDDEGNECPRELGEFVARRFYDCWVEVHTRANPPMRLRSGRVVRRF